MWCTCHYLCNADLTASELDPYGVKVLHNLNEDSYNKNEFDNGKSMKLVIINIM